jgi:hypothetical protein
MNLKDWWASQPPEKRKEIDRRAPALRPNADLAGKRDARYVVPAARGGKGTGKTTR